MPAHQERGRLKRIRAVHHRIGLLREKEDYNTMAVSFFAFGVVLILYWKGYGKKNVMRLLLVGIGVCCAVLLVQHFTGEKTMSYVEKNPAGEGSFEIGMQASVGDEDPVDVSITVPDMPYSKEEADALFQTAEEALDQILESALDEDGNLKQDVKLPDELPDSPVVIEWSSGDLSVLSTEGKILYPDEKGTDVTLTARLQIDDYEREYVKTVRVFPKEEVKTGEETLTDAVSRINENNEEDRYYLPDSIEGEPVTWREKGDQTAQILAVLLMIMAVFLIMRDLKETDRKETDRKNRLRKDYSDLISRLLLLTYAGLNIRSAVFRIASMYRENQKRSEKPVRREAFEEMENVCRDMENGVGETTAYEKMGTRCGLTSYKTLSVILIRSVRQGGASMRGLLEQEVLMSFEDAKRQAKAKGDLAAVKLLLPMAMMLVVVIIVVIVPSFLSFTAA